MRCPNDSSELIATDHQGIEIRTCPTCRGTWLEQDQLGQIIDQEIASQYTSGLGDLDDLEELDDGKGRNRRRDKYVEDFVEFERPRKGKRRQNRREGVAFDEIADFY